MTPKEKALAWVDEHFDECLAELKNAVACESYAGNEAGLEKMRGTRIPDYYDGMYKEGYQPYEILEAARNSIIHEREVRIAE